MNVHIFYEYIWKSVYYDEVMKTHNMQLCAPAEGVFNLKYYANKNV